jgi:hypothetical protein
MTMRDSRGTEESEAERLDRELSELVQELRVLLPGITVLFGFLLTLSFSRQFEDITGAEQVLFMVAFLSTALSVVLLVAPGVRHRTRFRDGDKEALIRSGNRLTIAGSVLLAVALAAVTTLVCEHLYGWTAGLVAGIGLFVVEVTLWFAWALVRQVSPRTDPPAGLVLPDSRPPSASAPGSPAAVDAPVGRR